MANVKRAIMAQTMDDMGGDELPQLLTELQVEELLDESI